MQLDYVMDDRSFVVVWDVRLRDQVIRLWVAIYDQQAQVFLGGRWERLLSR